ncbi:MAG: DUF503 domain-containing protein [Tissierellia bacterium]|nr:DUF503 domain-containing protein [Tissierellia bacterium]
MILALKIKLHLPACQSLKDKRRLLQSLLTRSRRQFQIAICELALQDKLQVTCLEACTCCESRVQAERVLGSFLRWIEATYDLDLVEVEWRDA